MEIENQFHTAVEIATHPASVETMESYEDRIPWYQSQNYSYIPLPVEGKYYNTEEGWLKEISGEQFIDEDTHIMEVLRRMQHHPFLLLDRNTMEEYYVVETDDGDLRVLYGMMVDGVLEGEREIMMPGIEDVAEKLQEKEGLSVHEFREEYPEKAEETLSYSFDEQYGIITLVDLNKRGVKQMLYKVISELSASLGTKIETQYPDSEEIFEHLRPSTIGRWKKDRIRGLNMHISEHMNLLEMMQVIQSSESSFVEECGFDSKSDVETLNSINDIRNRVMHANRSLIYDRKEIGEVIEVVNESQRITSSLN